MLKQISAKVKQISSAVVIIEKPHVVFQLLWFIDKWR